MYTDWSDNNPNANSSKSSDRPRGVTGHGPGGFANSGHDRSQSQRSTSSLNQQQQQQQQGRYLSYSPTMMQSSGNNPAYNNPNIDDPTNNNNRYRPSSSSTGRQHSNNMPPPSNAMATIGLNAELDLEGKHQQPGVGIKQQGPKRDEDADLNREMNDVLTLNRYAPSPSPPVTMTGRETPSLMPNQKELPSQSRPHSDHHSNHGGGSYGNNSNMPPPPNYYDQGNNDYYSPPYTHPGSQQAPNYESYNQTPQGYDNTYSQPSSSSWLNTPQQQQQQQQQQASSHDSRSRNQKHNENRGVPQSHDGGVLSPSSHLSSSSKKRSPTNAESDSVGWDNRTSTPPDSNQVDRVGSKKKMKCSPQSLFGSDNVDVAVSTPSHPSSTNPNDPYQYSSFGMEVDTPSNQIDSHLPFSPLGPSVNAPHNNPNTPSVPSSHHSHHRHSQHRGGPTGLFPENVLNTEPLPVDTSNHHHPFENRTNHHSHNRGTTYGAGGGKPQARGQKQVQHSPFSNYLETNMNPYHDSPGANGDGGFYHGGNDDMHRDSSYHPNQAPSSPTPFHQSNNPNISSSNNPNSSRLNASRQRFRDQSQHLRSSSNNPHNSSNNGGGGVSGTSSTPPPFIRLQIGNVGGMKQQETREGLKGINTALRNKPSSSRGGYDPSPLPQHSPFLRPGTMQHPNHSSYGRHSSHTVTPYDTEPHNVHDHHGANTPYDPSSASSERKSHSYQFGAPITSDTKPSSRYSSSSSSGNQNNYHMQHHSSYGSSGGMPPNSPYAQSSPYGAPPSYHSSSQSGYHNPYHHVSNHSNTPQKNNPYYHAHGKENDPMFYRGQGPPGSSPKSPSSSSSRQNNPNRNSARRVPCNCKRSRCLKLYCECFAAELFCEGCNCQDCHNTPTFDAVRTEAIKATRAKNPNAFMPRFNKNRGKVPGGSFASANIPVVHSTSMGQSGGHNMGCRCKKSACLKKYCECFEAGVVCGEKCKCLECLNFVGSQALIDRRRKIKDHRGAELAMRSADEAWKGNHRIPVPSSASSATSVLEPNPVGVLMERSSGRKQQWGGGMKPVKHSFESSQQQKKKLPQPFAPPHQGHERSYRSRDTIDVATPPYPSSSRKPKSSQPPSSSEQQQQQMTGGDTMPSAQQLSSSLSLPPFGVDSIQNNDTNKESSKAILPPTPRTPATRNLKFDPYSSKKARKMKLGDSEPALPVFGPKYPDQPKTTSLAIFSFLSNDDLYNASLVSKLWVSLSLDEELWQFQT